MTGEDGTSERGKFRFSDQRVCRASFSRTSSHHALWLTQVDQFFLLLFYVNSPYPPPSHSFREISHQLKSSSQPEARNKTSSFWMRETEAGQDFKL